MVGTEPYVIENSNVVFQNNLSVSASLNTETAAGVAPILTVQTGQFPCLLASLQITGNSIFLANYSFKVQLQGLNIYQNQFSLAAAGSSGTEFVQQGTTYLIPPNSTLYVYAYNSGGTGSNGLMNVFAVFDIQM